MSDKGGPTPSALQASEAAFDAVAEGYDDPDLPEGDFTHFVLSLQHMALVHLGDAPDPTDGKRAVDLGLARHNIDLISLLAQKTRGNLTGEEEHLLHQALYDLRMRFVEVAKTQR